MAKNIVQPKYCNCNISSDQKILKPNVNNSFCEKCGSILLKSSNGKLAPSAIFVAGGSFGVITGRLLATTAIDPLILLLPIHHLDLYII